MKLSPNAQAAIAFASGPILSFAGVVLFGGGVIGIALGHHKGGTVCAALGIAALFGAAKAWGWL